MPASRGFWLSVSCVVRTPSRACGAVTSSACCLRDLGGLRSADTGSHTLCARSYTCREGGSRPAEPCQPVRRGQGPTAALLGRAQSRDLGQRKRQDWGVQRPGTPRPTTWPRGGSRGTGLVGMFGGSTRDGAVWSGLRWEDPENASERCDICSRMERGQCHVAWRRASLAEKGAGGGAGLGTAVSCDHSSGLSASGLREKPF